MRRLRMIRGFIVCAVALWATGVQAHVLNTEQAAWGRKSYDLARTQRWAEAFGAADNTGSKTFEKVIRWYYLTRRGNDASFSEITQFINENKDWPQQDMLYRRAEEALVRAQDEETARKWFRSHPPKTAEGRLLFASSQLTLGLYEDETSESVLEMLREAWKDAELTVDEYNVLMAKHGKHFRMKDYVGKIDHLLWKRDVNGAQQLMPRVDDAHQRLFRARIAVINNEKNMDGLINSLPSAMVNDPGLAFDRIVYRDERGLDAGVEELLVKLPADVPYPEKVWSYRAEHVQKLLRSKQYRKAYTIARNNGLTEGENFARAEWLAGWISLRFLNDPKSAYTHFYKLHQGVKFPVSLSRAAYWAGKAAYANGNADIGANWLKVATQYPTTFFGQMALVTLNNGFNGFTLPDVGIPSEQEVQQFRQKELVKAVLALGDIEALELARTFLFHIANTSQEPQTHALVAEIGRQIGERQMAVRSAKNSLRSGVVLVKAGYPVVKFTPQAGIERALIMAVARQESEFDEQVVSPAGAIGLMQMMPATARETAQKLGMSYAPGMLTQPEYNLTLGSAFLNRLVNNYDGTLVMAVAAYNAGPGRVKQWVQEYGDPRKGQISEVDWVELIPFEETRNYVHRVLENLVVYRHLLRSPNQEPPVALPK